MRSRWINLLPQTIAAALILGGALALSAPDAFPRFVDVAAKVGITLMNICGGTSKDYIVEANGNGAAFFDYNNDGDMDVLIVNGSALDNYKKGGDPMVALYKNVGGTFVDVTRESGLVKRGWGMGACAGDYNNDGYQDLYITAYGPGTLFRNNGDGTFADVTASAGATNVHWSTNCAFGDYDRDGRLDLYVANYMTFDDSVPRRGKNPKCKFLGIDVFCGPQGLQGEPDVLFHNNGNGTFTDVTKSAGIKDPNYYGFGVVFSDFDNDGWPDIYVANDGNPNLLFHNNRNGTFTEMGVLSGAGLNEAGRAQSGMGVGIGDYDGNGFFDIFVTNFAGDTNTLYANLGKMLFTDVTSLAGLGEISLQYLGWGTGFEDFDNDGLPDIFVANGHVYPQVDGFETGQHYAQRKELYRNIGGGKFKEVARDVPSDLLTPKSSRGAAFGDFDNDGNIDVLVINMNDRPSLFRNEGGNQNHWITFRLKGTRSNRDAIGARVEIQAGGKTQVGEVRSGGSYLSNNDVRLHFGLGNASRVDRIHVRWPNGNVEDLPGTAADQFVIVNEQ